MSTKSVNSARRSEGMSLIEVMIAITILSVVLMALGGIMYDVARHSRDSAVATYRTGAAQLAVAWINRLPFDNLSNTIGCTSDSTGTLEYNRCITVTDPTPTLKMVQIVIQPTGNLTAVPDTQVIYRHDYLRPSPLLPQ